MLVLRVGQSTFCLRQHNIRSEQAASGREALEFLRLYEYDLVLMDLQLPDVPAYEVVRMMRAASLKVPVVIMSDTATVQAKVKALDQGADAVLEGEPSIRAHLLTLMSYEKPLPLAEHVRARLELVSARIDAHGVAFRDAAAQIASPFAGRPAFMALALTPGALDRPIKIDYPAAFG